MSKESKKTTNLYLLWKFAIVCVLVCSRLSRNEKWRYVLYGEEEFYKGFLFWFFIAQLLYFAVLSL